LELERHADHSAEEGLAEPPGRRPDDQERDVGGLAGTPPQTILRRRARNCEDRPDVTADLVGKRGAILDRLPQTEPELMLVGPVRQALGLDERKGFARTEREVARGPSSAVSDIDAGAAKHGM
jgi:hypothetical protein